MLLQNVTFFFNLCNYYDNQLIRCNKTLLQNCFACHKFKTCKNTYLKRFCFFVPCR